MFGTIRKHSKWLWLIIVTIVILTMVSFFSPTSQFSGPGGDSNNFGTIDGMRINRDQYGSALREAYLRFFLSHSPESRAQFDEQTETYQRLFLIQKVEQFHIDVDPASVAREASLILKNHEVTLDRLLQLVSRQVPMRDTDFERFVRHNLCVQQLGLVMGMSGDLVTPQEAQLLYTHQYRELAAEAVFFSGTNYLASVTNIPADALGAFYTNRIDTYVIPDRVQVSYVKFDLTNSLAAADQQIAALTNFNDIINQEYEKGRTNRFRDARSPEEAKETIRWQIRRELAMSAAHRKANEFAAELFNLNPMVTENLAVLAKTNGFTVGVTQPFDEIEGPKDLDGGPNFVRAAFRLTQEAPFFERVLVGSDAVYVIAFNSKIPRVIPPLPQIREKVIADYRHSQAVMLARVAGFGFARTLTNGLLAGKTFAEVALHAGLKPIPVPPFSLATQTLPVVEDHVSLREFQTVAFATAAGKSSDMTPTRDGGFVLYVQKRLPLDEAKMRADLPEFLASLRQSRRQEAFNIWLQKEASRALREVLAPRGQQPGGPGPGPGEPRS
jgi:SurA-like protein